MNDVLTAAHNLFISRFRTDITKIQSIKLLHAQHHRSIMELWIYDKILRFKGKDPLKRYKNHNYTQAEDALRMDLANEKSV